MECKVNIRPTSYGEPQTTATLTDEHAASSYGQPVLVFADGSALGPADYAYTLGNDETHPLIQRWNALVLPIIDEICRKNGESYSKQYPQKPIDTSWLDEEAQ